MVEWVTVGRARLICGDCRDILVGLEDVDMVFTSPPYNCGKDYGPASDSLELEEFKEFLGEGIIQANARVWVVNVGQYIGSRKNRVRFRDVLEDVFAYKPVDEVIWNKGPANGAAWGNYPNSPRIRAQHESLFVFGNPKMPNGNGLDWADWSRFTTSIWNIPAKVDLSTHPAMMPVEVAERAIKLWADVKGTVLDPFMGSGTSGVAAVRAGRDFIGIELNPEYFEIAVKRISEAQEQGDLFV